MSKVLYFEGAGCVPCGEVENCRIRTAFHSDNGEAIYLELVGVDVTKHTPKHLKHFTNIGFVDSCHYIKGDDDENKHVIYHRNSHKFEYTKANILEFVNSLGCSFDSVVILPDLAGYRVFGDHHGEYNFGDDFQFDQERTERAEEIRKHFYELEKIEGKRYPNLSLWVDGENPEVLHLLRHFNGYNKHWTIQNVQNWEETMTEATLGRSGC